MRPSKTVAPPAQMLIALIGVNIFMSFQSPATVERFYFGLYGREHWPLALAAALAGVLAGSADVKLTGTFIKGSLATRGVKVLGVLQRPYERGPAIGIAVYAINSLGEEAIRAAVLLVLLRVFGWAPVAAVLATALAINASRAVPWRARPAKLLDDVVLTIIVYCFGFVSAAAFHFLMNLYIVWPLMFGGAEREEGAGVGG